LCDIIEKNLYALKSIDNVIDEDLKNNLMVFNHNEDLKHKLLDVNSSYIPIRDKKFGEVLDDYTKNRVLIKFIYTQFFIIFILISISKNSN
jgi:hypothetical protein